MTKIEYPYDTYVVKKKSRGMLQTLSVENTLELANYEDGQSPLEYFSSKAYSGFRAVIINKGSSTQTASAMLSPKKYSLLKEKTETALFLERALLLDSLKGASTASSGSTSTPAYTVRFTMGTFKGKTPAQVLKENGGDKEPLVKQRDWLIRNAESNPNYRKNNMDQADAITDALKLLENGQLGSSTEPSGGGIGGTVVEIYNSGPHPNIQIVDHDGNSPVTEFKVVWTVGNKVPVYMEILTYHCPVVKNEDGTLNTKPLMKEGGCAKTPKIKATINLSSEDWENVLQYMYWGMSALVYDNHRSLKKAAVDAYFQNKEEAKKKTEEANASNGRYSEPARQEQKAPVETAEEQLFELSLKGPSEAKGGHVAFSGKIISTGENIMLVFKEAVIASFSWYKPFKDRIENGKPCQIKVYGVRHGKAIYFAKTAK